MRINKVSIYFFKYIYLIFNQYIVSEYSKKITEYNAKEKLRQATKGNILKKNQSNKWDLDIDVEKVKEQEKEELNEIIKIVKEKEELISQTEMVMQQKSIYNDTYKPQFISEMKEKELEDFSNVLSQKLRQVKLAISKANLGQTKFMSFEEGKKKKENEVNEFHKKVMREYLHKAHKVPYLKKDIPSHYNFSNNKIVNTNQRFKKYTNDCLEKYKETMKEFEKLGRKAKLKSRRIFKNLIKSYK